MLYLTITTDEISYHPSAEQAVMATGLVKLWDRAQPAAMVSKLGFGDEFKFNDDVSVICLSGITHSKRA